MQMNQPVWIPASQGAYHLGTVIAIEGPRFKVVWHDPDRKPGQPRVRGWYGPAHRLRTGVPPR